DWDNTNNFITDFSGCVYNDGTGDEYPTGLVDNNGVDLGYIERLPGIAHQYFSVDGLSFIGHYFLEGGSLDCYSFLMHRILSGTPIPAADISDGSSNPVAIIYDLLTNTQYGACVSASDINISSFISAAQYMNSHNIGMNITLVELEPMREIIDNICNQAGLVLWKDRNNKFNIRAYNPDDIINYDGMMNDDDFIEFSIDRTQFAEMPNEFKFTRKKYDPANHTDPQVMNETDIVTICNNAIFAINNYTKNIEDCDLSYLTKTATQRRVYEIVNEKTYPRRCIECTVNMTFADIEPMDLIMVTNTEHDLTNVPFRVNRVDYDEIGKNILLIKMTEAVEILADVSRDLSVGLRQVPGTSQNNEIITLCFPAYSYMSNVRVPAFTNENNVVVAWGPGQENFGVLERFTDYTIIDMNKIRLTAKWQSTVEANSLGLLNVQTYEAT
ncbi:MAG: hypothetical protein KKH70_20965, partial [Gammaproteobacteria bacterium]|nr:hypothetical protein [Gammaproteobacteria bacterium]